jgi:Carboxypeptidase regulatory-like domain
VSQIFQIAAHISTPWALAAFAIAAIVYLISKRRGKVPRIAWGAMAAIVLLGIVPIIIGQLGSSAIYRVRVNVIGPESTPVEDAKVWSSMGGEPKKVASGWEFDIPLESRPKDGKLTVWASLDTAYLKGSREMQLDHDHNPGVTIQLDSDKTATVRGIVIDRNGRAIAGTQVSVTGYEGESVVTQVDGNFVLPAHAARNQNVQLHAEAKGYKGANQYQPAGDKPATIVLDRK